MLQDGDRPVHAAALPTGELPDDLGAQARQIGGRRRADAARGARDYGGLSGMVCHSLISRFSSPLQLAVKDTKINAGVCSEAGDP